MWSSVLACVLSAAAWGRPHSLGTLCSSQAPLTALQGMLWVWMSPQGQAAAHTSPLPLPTELAAAPGGGQPTGLLLGGWWVALGRREAQGGGGAPALRRV